MQWSMEMIGLEKEADNTEEYYIPKILWSIMQDCQTAKNTGLLYSWI